MSVSKIYKNIALSLIALAVPETAYALSAISARYDGQYTAQTQVASSVSAGATCGEFAMPPITITKGMISAARTEQPAGRGFITEEGFVEASFTSPTGGKIDVSGRYENGEIVAGALDNTSGCAWIVHLRQ